MNAQVLVVGAGPVGLTLACELFRHGVPCRVIDRLPAPHAQSRATDIQPRTLEVFNAMGCLEDILSAGAERSNVAMFANGCKTLDLPLKGADTPFCSVLGLAQSDTERILEAHLASLGGRVERGVRLAHVDARSARPLAVLLHPDGRWQEPAFDWIVGCDGASSLVRRAIGDPFEGSTFEERFFLADVTLKTDRPEAEMSLWTSAHGAMIVLPIPGPRRARIFGDLDLDTDPEAELDEAACRHLLATRTHGQIDCADIGWSSIFRVHTRQVARYRDGRLLLAGDAAHLHSPAGGHGMNTGIQDAHNLAWKLALVLKGLADEALIDTYDAERRPVGRDVLSETDLETRMSLWRNTFGQELIGGLMALSALLPPVRRKLLARQFELDLHYKSDIIDEAHGSLLDAHMLPSDDDESPSLSQWRAFDRGPRAGTRAPDAPLSLGPHASLFELLGLHHVVLLFDGAANTDAGYEAMIEAAEQIASRWSLAARCFAVVPRDSAPTSLERACPVILDPSGALHARYGADAACLYVVRPDGVIGYRAQPLEPDALIRWFERTLL